MKNSTHYSIALILYFLIQATHFCCAQLTTSTPLKSLNTSGYAPVNGLKIYYEIHGDGNPLVLLHGSYMNIDMNWTQTYPTLQNLIK